MASDAGASAEYATAQKKLARLGDVDSLRELVRGVTLSFGLAFSAMLAAIYVPALLVLREMVESRQRSLPANEPSGTESVDPVTKIGAVVATLSPLLAGLVTNVLASK
ncbi:hypothetical protein [Roseateles sp.]|uniref:hypothetical protein n=1 Tax=Roseateles sp. TaxID=1971397 RepID=UPI003BA90492